MKETVLSYCTRVSSNNQSSVSLTINSKDYGLLGKIIDQNISLIYKLKLNPLIKEEMLKDFRTFRTVLEKSEPEKEKIT